MRFDGGIEREIRRVGAHGAQKDHHYDEKGEHPDDLAKEREHALRAYLSDHGVPLEHGLVLVKPAGYHAYR
jgi:hypothetical protein